MGTPHVFVLATNKFKKGDTLVANYTRGELKGELFQVAF